jgi:RNA polymerase sigma-54 factor
LKTVAELIIGNLDENGYLTASSEELAESLCAALPGIEMNSAECLTLIEQARAVVIHLDPPGVGTRDLRECLLCQLEALRHDLEIAEARRAKALVESESNEQRLQTIDTAALIVSQHLALLQKKDMRELVRLCRRPVERVNEAIDLIRTLDPRPGQRYSEVETRLIEPDVAFVKRDDEYVVVMNEEDMPALRLNKGYRRMLRKRRSTGKFESM